MNLNEEFSRLLPRLANISIKMPFGRVYAGFRKSSKRGNSEEFSDYSSYAEGDDLRRIDWNAYARSGKLFIKNNYDEKKAELNIFMDTSRSMTFGKKKFYVMLAAAVLCWAAKNDSVRIYAGGKIFRQDGDFFKTLKFIENISFGENDFRADFKRGLNVVMSDFLYDGIDLKFPKKPYCGASFVHIADELEAEPDIKGTATLCDIENNSELNVDEDMISIYKEEFSNLKKKIYEYSSRNNFSYSFVKAQADPVKILEII